MVTHPFVLLVEPNPLLGALIAGELKEHGCVVFNAADSHEALAFAALYPGSIDLAVADTATVSKSNLEFVNALRALPTGARTNDGMDSSRWCGIIVPVVKRPLRATAEEESRCNIQRSPLTSPSPCSKWRSRITRGVWMKSIG